MRTHAVPLRTSLQEFHGKFLRLSLASQFMIATSFVVIALMSVLTFWTAHRVEKAALSGAGTVGALYLQTFIAPLIDGVDLESDSLKPILDAKLVKLLGAGPLGQHVKEIKIWQRDGSLLYSTAGSTIDKPVMFEELAAAFAGEVVVSRTEEDKHPYSGEEKAGMLIEVYAPLWKDSSGRVALVGEFYEEPRYLITALESVRYSTFLVVGLITIPMLGMLYLIVRTGSKLIVKQQAAIEVNLRHALELSSQNNRLRLTAENARIEAGKLNEKIPDQIGCDLHDGPLQILTLVKLRLSDILAQQRLRTSDGRTEVTKIIGFVSGVLSDLRTMSSGLVLPELDEMKLEDAIRLSVERYCDLTGHSVELIGSVSRDISTTELNVCAYRFIQEALMNAFRHASGKGQKVRYNIRRNRLVLLVADLGKQYAPSNAWDVQRI